jgi:hypothetical protein
VEEEEVEVEEEEVASAISQAAGAHRIKRNYELCTGLVDLRYNSSSPFP